NPPSARETPPLDLRPLPGSERAPVPGAVPAAQPLDPQTTIAVTVVLRRRAAGELGAAPADVAAVTDTLSELGLQIVAVDEPSRRVRVTGTLERLEQVFGADLGPVEVPGADGLGASRQRTGPLSIPAAL